MCKSFVTTLFVLSSPSAGPELIAGTLVAGPQRLRVKEGSRFSSSLLWDISVGSNYFINIRSLFVAELRVEPPSSSLLFIC
jgi:hypothetical protein